MSSLDAPEPENQQELEEASIRFGPTLSADPAAVAYLSSLEARFAAIVDRLTGRERVVRRSFSGNTDSGGNATIEVGLEIAEGFEFSLHRLIVDDGVGSFSSPTAGGSAEIRVNEQRVEGVDLASGSPVGGLPATWWASSSAGIFLRGGDTLEIGLVSSGAVSKRVFGVVQGKLRRVRVGE